MNRMSGYIAAAICLGNALFCCGEEIKLPDLTQLIDRIAFNEQKIRDVSLKYKVTQLTTPSQPRSDYSWGYDRGKEFIRGHDFWIYKTNILVAFDGDAMTLFHEPGGGNPNSTGRTTTYDWSEIMSNSPPNLFSWILS